MADITTILAPYPAPTITLANRLRKLIFESLPAIQETPDFSAGIIGYGYGPGYKDMICTIILSKKGVKLGIWRGIELADPEGLLTGTGKLYKHIIIKTENDIANAAIIALLAEAKKTYNKRKLQKR